MGRFAMGTSALGKSSGVEVKVLKESPGPHNIKAWKSGEAGDLAGMVRIQAQSLCYWYAGERDSAILPGNMRKYGF